MDPCPEKILFDDSDIRVSDSFVTSFGKLIIPVSKIRDVSITHKSFSMYAAITLCLLSLSGLHFNAIGSTKFNAMMFVIPVFGSGCIWLRYAYERYVELHLTLDGQKEVLLRVVSMSKRSTVDQIALAIRTACEEYQAGLIDQEPDSTETMRIRRIRHIIQQANIELTPELSDMLELTPSARRKNDL